MPESHPAGQVKAMASEYAERRAWVRYASNLKVSIQETTEGAMKDAGWPGKVRDISAGGVGLLLRHCFSLGTPLYVELKNRDGSYKRTVLVRVRYIKSVSSYGEHGWHVGCAFAENLTDDEIKTLLD